MADPAVKRTKPTARFFGVAVNLSESPKLPLIVPFRAAGNGLRSRSSCPMSPNKLTGPVRMARWREPSMIFPRFLAESFSAVWLGPRTQNTPQRLLGT